MCVQEVVCPTFVFVLVALLCCEGRGFPGDGALLVCCTDFLQIGKYSRYRRCGGLTISEADQRFKRQVCHTGGPDSKNAKGVCVYRHFPAIRHSRKRWCKEVLSLALLWAEFQDTIRNGNGLRVESFTYQYSRSQITKNYAIGALNLLIQYKFLLSPRQREQLVWSHLIH